MRYGVIADIHANLHALDAVLRAIADDRVDGFVCAGDLVGYGALPNECVARVAEIGAVCVAGNHDLIAIGRLSDERCIRIARESLAWTRGTLNDQSRRYLERLKLRRELEGIVLVHGTLDDPSEYLHTPEAATAELERLPLVARGLIAGHTHAQMSLEHGSRFFLNPGAVGQSRDEVAEARFAVLDTDTDEVSLRSTPYDVDAARAVLRYVRLPTRSFHLKPSRLRKTAGTIRQALTRG